MKLNSHSINTVVTWIAVVLILVLGIKMTFVISTALLVGIFIPNMMFLLTVSRKYNNVVALAYADPLPHIQTGAKAVLYTLIDSTTSLVAIAILLVAFKVATLYDNWFADFGAQLTLILLLSMIINWGLHIVLLRARMSHLAKACLVEVEKK